MFFLSLKNGNDDPTRNSFGKYYMPLIEVKEFDELIDNKQFFDHPVKKNKKGMKKYLKYHEKMTTQHKTH